MHATRVYMQYKKGPLQKYVQCYKLTVDVWCLMLEFHDLQGELENSSSRLVSLPFRGKLPVGKLSPKTYM